MAAIDNGLKIAKADSATSPPSLDALSGSTAGGSQALARKLAGDPRNYPHLVSGRGRKGGQVLDLDPLRKALGASWSAYGGLIHNIALRILLRHLGGAYEHQRYGERYVVFFSDLSESEARERMARVASALAEFLFGSGSAAPDPMLGRGRWSGGRRRSRGLIAGWSASIGNGMSQALGRFVRVVGTLMAVNERAENARAGEASHPDRIASAAEPAAASPAHESRAAGDASLPADPAWSVRKTATARRGVFNAAAPRAEAATPRRRAEMADNKQAGETPAAQSAALQELAKRAAQNAPGTTKAAGKDQAPRAAAAAVKPAKPTEIAVEELAFVYRPVWSVRTNMLAIARCYPAGKLPGGELVVGDAVLPPAATLEVIEKVDRAALDHVMAHCLPIMESGRGAIIALPLHYETLQDRERRNNYLNACRGLSAAARKRLIFECHNVEGEIDQNALIQNLQQLKGFSTLTVGMLPLRTGNFALWKRAGLGGVGVDLAATPGEDDEIAEGLRQFAQMAGQQGLRTAVCNLNGVELATAALHAGFDFIESSAIQNHVGPSDMRPFTMDDLALQFAVTRRAKVAPSRLLDTTAEPAD